MEEAKQSRIDQENFKKALLEEEIRKKLERMDMFAEVQNRDQIPFGAIVGYRFFLTYT
jgi:hypothetical protein